MKCLGLLSLTAALCAGPMALAQAPAPMPARAPAPVWTPGVTQYDDIKTELGEIDGATFRIDFPAKWTGGLVIVNHGYDPNPRRPPAGPPNARTKLYTDRGFAVAQSSYSAGGWAVEQAMSDNEKLRKYFVRKYGKTNNVIATGGALGAGITMASLELYPDVYTGGLVTCCGTLTPVLETMQGFFRTMALFEYYFPGVLPPVVGPLDGFTWGGANDAKVEAAFKANPEKAEIFRRTTGRRMEHLANHITFQSFIIHEYQQRAGGNPFDNSTWIYTPDDDLVKVNNGVKRYVADPKAIEYARKWYTPTGKLKDPLFIMSPVYDPVTTMANTAGYLDIVRRAGHYDKVAFQFYDHEGHGAVSAEEVESAFDALLSWMKGGPKPPTGHGVNRGTARGAMTIGALPVTPR